MAEQNDPVLLVLKSNPRSTNLINRGLYERNKDSYIKAGYVEADQESVIEYFKKRGLSLTVAPKEPKTKKAKEIDSAESSGE